MITISHHFIIILGTSPIFMYPLLGVMIHFDSTRKQMRRWKSWGASLQKSLSSLYLRNKPWRWITKFFRKASKKNTRMFYQRLPYLLQIFLTNRYRFTQQSLPHQGCNRHQMHHYAGAIKHSWLENGPGLKMYFLLKVGDIPASYVSLPEGNNFWLRGSPEQWKNPGWLGHIGDYTTQLYWDYNKPL